MSLGGRVRWRADNRTTVCVPKHGLPGLMKHLQDSDAKIGLQIGTISRDLDVSVGVSRIPHASFTIERQTSR